MDLSLADRARIIAPAGQARLAARDEQAMVDSIVHAAAGGLLCKIPHDRHTAQIYAVGAGWWVVGRAIRASGVAARAHCRGWPRLSRVAKDLGSLAQRSGRGPAALAARPPWTLDYVDCLF